MCVAMPIPACAHCGICHGFIAAIGPGRLARLWCGLLDVEAGTTIGGGQFVAVSAGKGGLTAGFQRVPARVRLPGEHGHRRLA
jgi:hypothetical protein